MNDGIAIEIIYGGDEAIFEFRFGCDADVAQDGAGELGKEALDEIEPGAVLRRDDEGEAPFWLCGKPSLGFLGYVGRVIVENELDRRGWRIGGVEFLQEGDELARTMPFLDAGVDRAGQKGVVVGT